MSWNLLTVVDSTDGSIANGTAVTDWTLNEIIVNHGRRSIGEDVPPSNATLGFIWDASGAPDLEGFVIGRRVQVWLQIDAYPTTPICLFDGGITDVVVTDTILSIIAVTRPLAEIGRQTVTLGIIITLRTVPVYRSYAEIEISPFLPSVFRYSDLPVYRRGLAL